MDIDIVEENEQQLQPEPVKVTGKRPANLPVDEAHPFDLEAYISSYKGRTYVDRLVQIIALCPSIAAQALQLALLEVFQMRDVNLYRTVLSTYEQVSVASNGQLPLVGDIAPLNQKWIDETNQKNQVDRTKLEVELKTYTSNMIKESIRMAQRDLGTFYRSVGDHTAALKYTSKSREFCTTNQHVLDICLSILELLIEYRNYAHISTYAYKADTALEATANMVRANSNSAGATAPASQPSVKERVTAEREKVQTKLDVAMALSHLGQGNYEKAAGAFVKIGPIKGLGDWTGRIVAPGDIAIYATLCVLATFTRGAIRAQVLDNDNFGVYIEQEPYVRELIEAYMGNRFKAVLEILDRYTTRHFIDIHLSVHVTNLTNLIRSRALVLYFQPFASIKLERMSTAFGWTIEELEEQVVSLIQAGEIKARIDRQNKILKAREVDQRTALFTRAVKTGADMQAANRKLLLRLRLQQADLVVKAPKGQSLMPHSSELVNMY
ncbi:G protein pathway suppressor 1 [Sparassis latifolia]|uniref:COP9 signalosome complex subunit 1 n=1 Tax=Sparassis crispa TaxID=139825 RepID=A0A401GMS1_9APHY|nr:COP9 signalosome complex subunit 1 [Sparassis crispa]GBE83515.1 COP9 signalosome complex subunit 1 [Sparassis crispa]